MSANRPRITFAANPTTIQFDNLTTEEDMKLALTLIPRSVHNAIFLDEGHLREVVDAIDGTHVVDDEKDVPPGTITPQAINYFLKRNKQKQQIQHVTFQDIDSTHVPALAKGLTADKQLLSLRFNPIGLTNNDMVALNMALKAGSILHTLHISNGVNWGYRAILALEHTNLAALYTAGNELNGAQAARLLNTHPHLTLLDISENNLCVEDDGNNDDDIDGTVSQSSLSSSPSEREDSSAQDAKLSSPLNNLMTAVQTHRALRTIMLRACHLGTVSKPEQRNVARHVKAKEDLFTALVTHATLTDINIESNPLSSNTLDLLAFYTLENKTLSALNIFSCLVQPQMPVDKKDEKYPQANMRTFKPIRRLLASRLTYLNLGKNNLSDEALEFFSLTLTNNRYLTHLILRENDITNEGLQHLVPFLERTKTLQVLDLSWNSIEFHGLYTILQALQNNPNCVVHTLKLQGCRINTFEVFTEAGINDILKKLPRSLLCFDITLNGISRDLNLMLRINQKLQAHQRLLRYVQQTSPLIAFVRAHGVKHPYHGSILPLIPEITEHLGSGTIAVDIREHREAVGVSKARK